MRNIVSSLKKSAKKITITCIDDFFALFRNFIRDLAHKNEFLSIS